jgi:hypothetical protein
LLLKLLVRVGSESDVNNVNGEWNFDRIHPNHEGVALQVGVDRDRSDRKFFGVAGPDRGGYTGGAIDKTVNVVVEGVVGVEEKVLRCCAPVSVFLPG